MASRILPRLSSQARLPARSISTTSRLSARKDTQDKDSLNTSSTEYSKSGGDDAAAKATEDVAFSRDQTRPDEEMKSAAKETSEKGKANPLDVSPANHDVSQPRQPQEGGAQGSEGETGQSSGRQRTSGGGSPRKSGT